MFDDCSAISCVRQLTGKKSYVNFQIEAECRYAKNDTCKYPKYVRKIFTPPTTPMQKVTE